MSGLDGFFGRTHIVLLILFGICCPVISLILGIVGLVTCRDPQAKQNAMIVTILAAVFGGVAGLMHMMGFGWR